MDPTLIASDFCLQGLLAFSEEYIRFVHGTTTEIFDETAGVRASGNGEFGKGFYVYLASGREQNWSIKAASQWARLKAANPAGTACLVFVEIRTQSFFELTKRRVEPDDCEDVVAKLKPDGRARVDLVYGPLCRRGQSVRTARRAYPCQFKFEESAVGLLAITEIRKLAL